jgi:hypothetical protein
VTDKNVDITERLQKIGQTVSEYKDSLMNHFQDMDVEVKNWNFAVGNTDKEYTVEINLKLSIKPKKA